MISLKVLLLMRIFLIVGEIRLSEDIIMSEIVGEMFLLIV